MKEKRVFLLLALAPSSYCELTSGCPVWLFASRRTRDIKVSYF